MAALDLGASRPGPNLPRRLSPGDLARGAILHAHRSAEYLQAVAPLVADLEAAGFRPERLGDLARPGGGDHRALPVLLHWLTRIGNTDVKVDIVAALASPWARPRALAPLVAEYRESQAAGAEAARIRAAICTTLAWIADDSIAEDLLEIAADDAHGDERGMAIVALGSLQDHRDRAIALLVELLDEPAVTLFAVLGLSRAGARHELPALLTAAGHPNPIVRAVVRQTLRRWSEPSPR